MNKERLFALIGIIFSFLFLLTISTNFFGFFEFNNLEAFYWFSRLEIWIVLFTIIIYSKYIEKKNLLLWNTNNKGIIFYIISVISIVFMVGILGIGYSLINKYFNISLMGEMYKQQQLIFKNNISILIFTVFTAGITEELIFRGYFMTRLEIITKNKWSIIIISSLLFGLIHLRYGNIMALILPFLIGLVFALYYYKYRNLIVLIISHLIIDFISFN